MINLIRTMMMCWMVACSTLAYAQVPNLTLTSTAFLADGSIPSKYTCKGENVNPPLEISYVPVYTKSLVLVVHDPDAQGSDFIHWVVYNIDPMTKHIAENSAPGKQLINNFHQFDYSGPCPPNGLTHHYVFDLYALDKSFVMNENGTLEGLMRMMQGHVLAKTQLVGLYPKS